MTAVTGRKFCSENTATSKSDDQRIAYSGVVVMVPVDDDNSGGDSSKRYSINVAATDDHRWE